MADLSVLPFEHPTTVALVDDDTSYLHQFPLSIATLGTVKTYDSPLVAVKAIRTQLDQRKAKSGPKQRLGMVGGSERFDTFSVVVSDYEMGAMNGIELCSEFRDAPMGRIILTGRLDERHAINAFNDKIIDRYVRKDDPQQVNLVRQFIVELKREYFLRLASKIDQKQLILEHDYLFDQQFDAFFAEVRESNDVVEHYLDFDLPGFVMLDSEGEILACKVISEKQLAEQVEKAEVRKAPAELLDLLRKGQVVPVFPTADGCYTSEFADKWRQCTFMSQKVRGEKTYFTTVVSGTPAQALVGQPSIYSYNEYLETH